MVGKAAYFAEAIKSASDWPTAMNLFVNEFSVDPNVIIGELRILRCVDYDVNKYSDDFVAKTARLDKSKPGLQEQLKMIFADGLPFKVKELLHREKGYY